MHEMVSSIQTLTFQGGDGFSREARHFFFFPDKLFQGSDFFSVFHWTLRSSVCMCARAHACVGECYKFFFISRRVDSDGRIP